MSNRDLAAAAAIVWGIAVLIGVFIAAPLWFGFDVDAGLIANALVALGTFAAAAAAVWVATTDRRERARERDVEDTVQAKLVVVTPRRPTNPLEIQIQVVNHGTRAITDITFVDLAVEAHDLGELQPGVGPFPVVAAPGGGPSLFTFSTDGYDPTHPYYIAVKGGPNNEPQTITSSTRLTATIRWTDASGKTWQRSGSGPANASRVDLGTPVRIRT